MKHSLLRLTADYGGMVNAALCIIHCAAGPVLLALWGAHLKEIGPLDIGFLLVSAVLVAGATWRMSSWGLRAALWGFFALFAGAMLLVEEYPAVHLVQYAASVGLIGTHLLNLRHGRRCLAQARNIQY